MKREKAEERCHIVTITLSGDIIDILTAHIIIGLFSGQITVMNMIMMTQIQNETITTPWMTNNTLDITDG